MHHTYMHQDQGSRITVEDGGPHAWRGPHDLLPKAQIQKSKMAFKYKIFSFSAAQLICFCTTNALMHTNFAL